MEVNDSQMAEINLKTLFVTCKSQWNGDLSKHKEAEVTLKATQNALQALLQQVSVCCKENDKQMRNLQTQLSDVAAHLSKPSDEQRTSEETANLLRTYNQLLSESKVSAKKTAEQLMTFGSIRNAVVSMEIKTPDGEKLAAPLFDSALLNFPSEGSNAHETNLLTSLSFLILSSTQKEQWKSPVVTAKPGTTPSESTEKVSKKTKKQIKAEAIVSEESNLVKPEDSKSKDTPEGKLKKSTGGKEAEFKKSMDHATMGGIRSSKAREHQGNKPQHMNKNRGMADGSKSSDPRKPFPNNAHTPRKVGDFIPQHRPAFHNIPTSPPIMQAPNVCHAPAPPPPMLLPQSYCTPPPAVLPSLLSLHNKKAFFVLAVNGKQYGKIVFELRPDVAPIMCQRFAQNCLSTEGDSYRGTIIYQWKPKAFIMGGRVPGPESLYMADPSPLKKMRGSIFFRLKRDYVKTQCSIVSTDFTILLDDEKADNYRTSTVFGYVCDGLAVCDAISHMDYEKDHVAVCSAGIQ